jgi:hypothetical protein
MRGAARRHGQDVPAAEIAGVLVTQWRERV